MDPSDIPLPAVLEPILGFLQDRLPSPLYSTVLSFLSHSLALVTAVLNLLVSLFSKSPSEWDTQTILPPLIAFLTAYLALVGLYRTTTWAFRSALFFVKWGTIVGALVAGWAWMLGNAGNNNGALAVLSGLGAFLNSDTGTPSGGRSSRRKSRSARKERPKAWQSFADHQAWQYQEKEETAALREDDVSKLLKDVLAKFMGSSEPKVGVKEQHGRSKGSKSR